MWAVHDMHLVGRSSTAELWGTMQLQLPRVGAGVMVHYSGCSIAAMWPTTQHVCLVLHGN
jgi:hypothetical protein